MRRLERLHVLRRYSRPRCIVIRYARWHHDPPGPRRVFKPYFTCMAGLSDRRRCRCASEATPGEPGAVELPGID